MADDLKFNLEVTTGQGSQQVKALATALTGLSKEMRDVSKMATTLATSMEASARGTTKIAQGAQTAAKSLKDLASAEASAFARKHAQGLPMSQAAEGKAASQAARDAAARVAALNPVTAKQRELNNQLKEEIRLRLAAAQAARGGKAVGLAGNVQISNAYAAAQRKAAQAVTLRTQKEQQLRAANIASAQAELAHMNRLTNLRYTLYDVQRSFLVTSAALLGFNAITVKAAMQYETAMAQISRTSGTGGAALANLKGDFQELAATIPTSFQNITEIGTLAGQLNIPAGRIAEFTKVTAQFAATTNVAADTAATAFGRLDALLPDVQGNYNALGSSILNVGVNSVATESEIISTTNQIAAAGAQAGFASKAIIGLAASYASLGVAPEAARGTTIRFFSTINRAITQGGANLDTFAQLAGMSVQEFSTRFRDAETNVETFLAILDGLKEKGGDAETVLRSMSITAVRDINALLKLSQNSEIVAKNFGYAAEGFDNANQLAAAFGIQSATLASKLQMLGNSVQALFSEIGESALWPIGLAVDALKNLAVVFTELAKNPLVQTMALIVGVFTTLVGVTALLGFAFSRVLSASIAVRTSLATLKAEAYATTGGLGGLRAQAGALTAALYGTSTATKVLGGALVMLKGLAFVAVLAAGIQAISTAVNSLKSNAEKAKDAFGDLSGLSSALKQDTDEVAKGMQESLGSVEGEIRRTQTTTNAWVTELEEATGAQIDLSDSTQTTTTHINKMTYAIGKNTAAWLSNKLATDPAVQNMFKQINKLAGLGLPSPDTSGFLTAAVKNDVAGAKKILDEYQEDLNVYIRENQTATNDVVNSRAFIEAKAIIGELKDTLDLTTGALEEAATAGQITTAVNEGLGVSADAAAKAMGDMSDEAEVSANALDTLRQSVEAVFSKDNLLATMADDFYKLAQGIYESGNAVDGFSQAGQTNLENFQQSIASIIAAGESMGYSASQSVAVLFLQLQKLGIDTANLLSRVANIPGVSVGEVNAAMKDSSIIGSTFSQVLNEVSNNAKKAGDSLGGGGRKSTAGGARRATKEVRTLLDWASDLAQVMNRAFDIRFSVDQGVDEIASAWQDVAEQTAQAKQNIMDIQAEIAKITAEKAINEYFLGVANQYGDALRAGDLSADIAKNNADLADKNKDLAKEQSKVNKTLTGNSEAAIENRKVILDLVQDNIDLIEAYAASGATQKQVAAYAAKLKKDFEAQAKAAGFSAGEIAKYSKSFDDAALAINRVPRNITVSANTNPAIQALNELEAKIKKTANAPITVGGGGGVGIDSKTKNNAVTAGKLLGKLWAEAFKKYVKANPIKLNAYLSEKGKPVYQTSTGALFFKSGGYTGNGSENKVVGGVHGKEFVVNAENTAKFRPILEAMNRGQMPIAQVPSRSAGTRVVELSVYDRKLLAAAGNVALFIDGKQVSQAASHANFVATQRGSN